SWHAGGSQFRPQGHRPCRGLSAGVSASDERSRMIATIVRTIARADAEDIRRLGAAGVATVHEAHVRTGLLRPYIRPVYASARVAGSAVTVLCGAGDNLMIHAAIAVVQPGDVLVVS